MAKKKRKRKRPDRPVSRAGTTTAVAEPKADERPSARAARKEQARRDRERRIKQARRRQRARKATRWGIAAAVAAGIAGGIWLVNREGQELQRAAQEAAGRINASPIETVQDEVDAAAALDQATLHSPPFSEGQNGVPVTAGSHSSPLPSRPYVYDQPIPEANAVHNLEHGYVLIYYAPDGENALADDIRSELEDLAESESNKVLVAPYPGLANSIALVAWGKLQTIDPPVDADPNDAATVAQAFIDQFRSGGLAPEPSGV